MSFALTYFLFVTDPDGAGTAAGVPAALAIRRVRLRTLSSQIAVYRYRECDRDNPLLPSPAAFRHYRGCFGSCRWKARTPSGPGESWPALCRPYRARVHV